MTTNIFDGHACVMATDSRWSIRHGDWLLYLDDTNYQKIERSHGKALMFAGFGGKIQEWKNWIRSNPADDSGMPEFKGVSVCMVDESTHEVDMTDEKYYINNNVYCAGSGKELAYGCWLVNKSSKQAVETAKSKDFCSGGDVKFIDFKNSETNLVNFYPEAEPTIEKVSLAIAQRGISMKLSTQSAPILPFSKADAAASEEAVVRAEIAGLVANGQLSADAPCDGMHDDWSEENKAKFKAALGKMFGWKN